VRARQTWEIAAAALARPPTFSLEPALYAAEPLDVIDVARKAPDRAHTLLLVGHEPTLSETAELLAGPGSDPAALDRLLVKFPTNGIAVLRFEGAWPDLGPGRAVLEVFAVPRAALTR
jgi:phosphohistidine phosphatase